MERPAISVIIPAWGVADLVGEALGSLQAQDFADWEAIVVDDGAPDDVAGAVAPFAADDPRIRFVATPHGGISAARNNAIRASTAPLIALLDGDDAFRPDYLGRMVAAMADPGVGLATCDAIYFGLPKRTGQRFSAYSTQTGPFTLESVIRRGFNVYIGSTLRRAAFDAVGGFDETLSAAEDLDMWLRLLGAGWRGVYVPEPMGLYRRRAGSLSMATLKMQRATAQLYARAAEQLGDRLEAASARAMAAKAQAEADWIEGQQRVIEGRVEDGLALLRAAGAASRNLRWRAMMALFQAAPTTARPLLRWRRQREAAHHLR